MLQFIKRAKVIHSKYPLIPRLSQAYPPIFVIYFDIIHRVIHIMHSYFVISVPLQGTNPVIKHSTSSSKTYTRIFLESSLCILVINRLYFCLFHKSS